MAGRTQRFFDRFKRDLEAEVQMLHDDISRAVEGTGLYGWNLVSAATPVLTGRARGSWLLTVDQIDDATLPAVKRKGKKRAYGRQTPPIAVYDIDVNNRLFITNNVEYIGYLEYGTPFFAAFSMVQRSVPKMERYLNRRFKVIDKKRYVQ